METGRDGRTLRYRSVHDLNRAVVRWSRSLPTDIDLIVGVPRSGLLAASLLALHMHRPLTDLAAFLASAEPWSGLRLDDTGNGHRRILLVDDTSNTGTEMRRVRAAMTAAGISLDGVQFGAVYVTELGKTQVDTYAEVLPTPRAFEWNILHHKDLLAKACMDIDGVLCADPRDDQNDDSDQYRAFLSDTELRYRPSVKVGKLVTSRLEKYRPETEQWLARHGVEYGELVMLDLPSAEERRRLNAHARHKADVYGASDCDLFIESSASEASEIYSLTGRPVFVTDTREFLGEGSSALFQEAMRYRATDRARHVARKALGPRGRAIAKQLLRR